MSFLRILIATFPILHSAIGRANQWSFYSYKNTGHQEGTVFLKEVLAGDRKTENPMYCGTYCMVTDSCLGFFFKENEFCRLVSISMLQEKLYTPGIQYFERAMCLSIPNLCYSGVCIPHRSNNSYTCKCPKDVSGKYCQQLTFILNSNDHDAQFNHQRNTCYSANVHGSMSYDKGERNTISYRFKLDKIHNTSEILSAKIQFTIKVASHGFNYVIYIKAIKMADTSSFNLIKCDFKDNSLRTMSKVSWHGPHPATNVGDSIETPDISSIIKEVVSIPKWSEGNYIDIVFYNDDLPDVDDTAGIYDSYPSMIPETAPKMIITLK